MAEFWVMQRSIARTIGATAAWLEDAGWDGIALGDNQNLTGDWVVAATAAALATSRVGLMTGVTNPVTRHPVVLAAAAFGVHELSRGRMTLAVGRGDSALAYVGLAPLSVARFARATEQLAQLLRGEPISLSDAASFGGAPPVETLGYGNLPDDSRIEWIEPDVSVPLEVVGTGPRTIAVGARFAERISFSLGADASRLAWAIDIARDEAERAGRDPGSLSFGAYVQAVCHPDQQHATELGRHLVGGLARFMALGGRTVVPVSDRDRAAVEAIKSRYDMSRHGYAGPQSELIDDGFAQRFSVFGPPEYCATRFAELFDIGINRIIVMPVRAGTEAQQRDSLERLANEVLPTFDRSERSSPDRPTDRPSNMGET
jgi:5,10-methylenetetrahydromethanopterin reductase